MMKMSLTALGRELLHRADKELSGRSSDTVYGGNEKALRQTVIALRQGHSLDDHDNHDESTVYVMSGRVRLSAGKSSWTGWAGNLLVIPYGRVDGLEALEDSTLLLTVSKPRS
jgi:quercetin dioxygenase-like cupin family protein